MYRINYYKLLPGDIILSRSDDETSKKVREYTQSDYSHAMIYTGYTTCIDSDMDGVHSRNIERLLFNQIDDVLVLRLKDFNEDVILGAIQFCKQKVGTQYSLREAYSVTSGNSSAKEKNRQFCTRFVAQAYNSVGLNIAARPDYCTAKDLYESKMLITVEDVLEVASSKDVDMSEQADTLPYQQIDIENEILKKSRNLTKSDIQTFEQLAKFVLENQTYEIEITKIVKESGYLELWKEQKAFNPWFYDKYLYLGIFQEPEEREKKANFQLIFEPWLRHWYQINLDTMKFGYNFHQQEFFSLQIDLYEKLIELSIIREQVVRDALNL